MPRIEGPIPPCEALSAQSCNKRIEIRLELNRLATDQKTVAERRWTAPLKAPKPQQPCDIGLFGDDHLQLDLVEMLQDPTND